MLSPASAQNDIEQRLPQIDRVQDRAKIRAPAVPPLTQQFSQPVQGEVKSFVLAAVVIEGATVFEPKDLASAYEPYLARAVSLTDVAQIADAITRKYRAAGYFLSRAAIPQQDASDGILRVRVYEGYVSDVAFEGDAPEAVKRRVMRIAQERPLKLTTLENTLLLVQDMNGIVFTGTRLEPNLQMPEAFRLLLAIKQKAVAGALFVDNRGNNATGPLQAYSRLAANSVFRTGDQLAVEAFGVPDDPSEIKYGGISYSVPVSVRGTMLTADGAATTIHADNALNAETHNARAGIRVSHPFVRKRNDILVGTFGINFQNIDERVFGVINYQDRIRTAYAAADYASQRWNGLTSITFRAAAGFDVPGENDAPVHSRPDADGRYLKFTLDLSRYQSIGDLAGLYVAGRGQYSATPLLASEEVQLGGAQFGRGYDYGEIAGESGIAGLIEGRVGKDPHVPGITFLQFYSYYDAGAVWNRNAVGSGRYTLSSAGSGVRLTLLKSIVMSLEAAKPLTRTPFSQGDKTVRTFFSTSVSF
ncbi:MAG: ShlB/FhaC/HecB family hemolysin secretion/activation protein [Alphaproteobacteria bacterium]